MNRLVSYLFVSICLLVSHDALTQQFFTVGPNKETCEGKPVQIGPPDVNPILCYHWEPATFLSCADCPNPMASPNQDIKYTLFITDDDFSTSFTDTMAVTISFGGIEFDKQNMKQATMETATATLTRYDGGGVMWEFVGDDLGCTKSASSGPSVVITPGDRFGTITIKATKISDPECQSEASIDVNDGVKDIEIMDLMTVPGSVRKATTGQTLHVIGDNMVKVTAIPNDGESFVSPAPRWHTPFANSVNVPDGTISYNFNIPSLGAQAFTAGFGAPDNQPTTYMNLDIPVTETIDLQELEDLLNSGFTEPIKKNAKFGPPAPDLTVVLVVGGTTLKKTPVEKYNSPDLADKLEFELNASLTITSTIFHPALTKTIAFPAILGGETLAMSIVSLSGIGAFSISGGFESDPSKADDSWTLKTQLQAQASLAIKATVGGAFNFGGWTLKGEASAQATVGATFTWDANNPNVLSQKSFVQPLNMEIKLFLENNIDPREKLNLVGPQNYELVPKFETAPLIISLGSIFGE